MTAVNTIVSKRTPHNREALLDPVGSFWKGSSSTIITLLPTPLGQQPSLYVRYAEKEFGKIKKIDIKSAHNGEDIFFNLEWFVDKPVTRMSEESPFVDAAGILIPMKHDAPHMIMVSMGSEAYEVNAWYWRADEPDNPRNVWAKGLGTTVTSKQSFLFSRAVLTGNIWNVVIGRKMQLPEQKDHAVQLLPGIKTLVSFAAWAGANQERGGIKGFCPAPIELIIEA
jgi:DMSO reductase family type II enzyme heme b subunit